MRWHKLTILAIIILISFPVIFSEKVHASDKGIVEDAEGVENTDDNGAAKEKGGAIKEKGGEKKTKTGIVSEIFGKTEESEKTIFEKSDKKEVEEVKIELDEEEKASIEKEIDELEKEIDEKEEKKEKEEKEEKQEEGSKEVDVKDTEEVTEEEAGAEDEKETGDAEEGKSDGQKEEGEEKSKEEKKESKEEAKKDSEVEGAEAIEGEILTNEIKKKVLEEVYRISTEGEKPSVKGIEKSFAKKAEKKPELVIDIALDPGSEESILSNLNKKRLVKKKTDLILNKLKKGNVSLDAVNKELGMVEIEEGAITWGLEETKRQYKQAIGNIRIKKVANRAGNATVVSLFLRPEKELYNVSIYEVIPKSLVEHAGGITFYNSNFEIMESDPLLVWHFAQLKSDEEIHYSLNNKANMEALKEIKTVPTAENVEEPNKEDNFLAITLFSFGTILIILCVLFLHKFSPEEESTLSDRKVVEEAINRLTYYLRSRAALGIKKEHLRQYLLMQGFPKNLVDKALKNADFRERLAEQ